MAVIKIEILSMEMIKPSSPTPQHLRNLKLSFLDQIAPPTYVPLLLFYQPAHHQSDHFTDHRTQKSRFLKQSLSNTLTHFYPLAGRIRNNLSIDCNDEGALYIEAQVHAPLSNVINDPTIEALKPCLPIEPYGNKNIGITQQILLAIQTNFFDCGGIVVSVCISHKIADGSSLVAFLNAWTNIACGASKIVQPTFDLALHFPPRDHLSGFPPNTGITEEKMATRRFVFNKTALAGLKEGSRSQVKDPTRVEALSAFIWKHVMEVYKVGNNKKIYHTAVHALNLRPRMSPPKPEASIGNLMTFSATSSTSGNERDYDHLVSLLRSAIKKIDSDYVKNDLTDLDGYLDYLKRVREEVSKAEVEFCNFSSWCRFPFYEVDFGWGGPVWVSTTTVPFKNLVILMSTRCGDGIEAWITLLEEDMAKLEGDQKFLSLVAKDGFVA